MNTYLLYLIAKLSLSILKWLPLSLSLACAKMLGNMAYFINLKQRRLAYTNLRAAFSRERTPRQLRKILKRSYQNLGLMIAEIAKFPKLNDDYIRKHIEISNLVQADEAKNKGKGVIFLTAHFGNWELSAQAASIKGYPMKVLARQQRYNRLNRLLNSYRSANNCQVVTKGFNMKDILRGLNKGEFIGMLGDQNSSRDGVMVDFLGRKIYTPTGPVSIAQKTKSRILPAFIVRKEGPNHSIFIYRALDTEDKKINPQSELQEFHNKLSNYIKKYPEQWLWMQKKWKSSPMRSVLILNDGKAGHLNQAKAAARLLEEQLEKKDFYIQAPYAKNRGYKIIDVKFKSKFSRFFLNLLSLFNLGYCQGCLKRVLDKSCYEELISNYADYIISCGSSTAALNLIFSKENNAKSIIIMKPPFKVSSFDLAIIPEHDKPHKSSNIVVSKGALSLFDKNYINKNKEVLQNKISLTKINTVGLFFGGDNPVYKYNDVQIKLILSQLKEAVETINGQILATTSRRTGPHFESLFEEYLANYQRCKYLVLAGRSNPAYTVGGILGLSNIILVSFDSTSMISEAVNSGKYVIVIVPQDFASRTLTDKHKRLIDNFARQGYLHIARFTEIRDKIIYILNSKPEIKTLKDDQKISKALSKLV